MFLASVMSAFICFKDVKPDSQKCQPLIINWYGERKKGVYDNWTQIYIVVLTRDGWEGVVLLGRGEVWTNESFTEVGERFRCPISSF